MTDKQTQEQAPKGNMLKDPDQWTTRYGQRPAGMTVQRVRRRPIGTHARLLKAILPRLAMLKA